MRTNYLLRTGLLALIMGLIACISVQAIPSLDAQNWDTLTVDEKIGNITNETNITIIRDSAKPLVWYYVPSKPRLAEVTTKKEGKKVTKPIFQLMTLQTKSAKTKKIYEEGLLQFSLRMDLQPETASQAKDLIFKKAVADTQRNKEQITKLQAEIVELEKDKGTNKDIIAFKKKSIKQIDDIAKVDSLNQITLLPLPISSATCAIYKPSGEWMSGGIQQPGIAPIFSTQAVPFQINLTSFGADAMKALTQKGQGGLGVYYEMYFEGVLPPSTLKVEVDWDQTFSHFSENEKKETSWGCLFAAGSNKTDTTTITEDLVENKCIKITTEGREDDLEALQQVLDPILERINAELIEKTKAPEKVDPAAASNPKGTWGLFSSSNRSYAMKDKKVTKKGKEVMTFNRSKIITRATSCGTFIGIGNYDPKIIAEANIVMDPGNWEKAYYTIPAVGNDPSLISITLNQYVQYKAGSGKTAGALPQFSGTENPQLITWKPDGAGDRAAWVDREGEAVNNISWPLQAIFADAKKAGKDINDFVEYKVEIIISSRGKGALVDEVKLTKVLPMMTGDKPVTNPMALVDSLTVSADYLTLDKSEGLKKAMFQIERKSADGKTRLARYSWNFDYKNYDNGDTTHSWFIPKEGTFQYIPKVSFILHKRNSENKNRIDWEYNGKDLLGPEGYGYLEVDPGDECWDLDGDF